MGKLYCSRISRFYARIQSQIERKQLEVAAEAVGAKLVSYTGLRGPYDFLAVFEGTFAQGAGVKMATEASGALCDIAVCEAINI